MLLLALASLISSPFIKNVFDVRKEQKYRELAGSLFWSLIPFAVVCLYWAATGDASVNARNLVLGLLGAAIGASGLIWTGYFFHDRTAQAQTAGSTMTIRDTLASALNDLGARPDRHRGRAFVAG